MKTANLYTKDQNMGFLVDDALFSDSTSARIRAVNQLWRDYGLSALPIIEEIVQTLPLTDDVFRAFCVNVTSKIRAQVEREKRHA
jgi:hypothetical protein